MGSQTEMLDLQSELAAMDVGLTIDSTLTLAGAQPQQTHTLTDPGLDEIFLGVADDWIVASAPDAADNSSFIGPEPVAFALSNSQQDIRPQTLQQHADGQQAKFRSAASHEFLIQIQQLAQPQSQGELQPPQTPPGNMQLPQAPTQGPVVAMQSPQFAQLPAASHQYQQPQTPPAYQAAPPPQPGQLYDPLAHIPAEVKAQMWAQMQAELAKDAAEIPATNRQRQLAEAQDSTQAEPSSGGFGLGIPDKYTPLSPSTLEWEQNRPWANLPNAAAVAAALDNSADLDPAWKRKRADRPRGSVSGDSNAGIDSNSLGEMNRMGSFNMEASGDECEGEVRLPKPEGVVKCPRCGSENTKFCYYNNKNIKQPRYLCKGCGKYWTAGGLLRREKAKDPKGTKPSTQAD